MGHVLHGNATTTPRIRKEIQESMESAPRLARLYNLNVKTILKWKKASGVVDKRAGPAHPKSALSLTEQQMICEFRRITKLPLDDVFIALKEAIPALSRSNLHRCLRRHGLNVLPKEEKVAREKKKFKSYGIGFVHVDITQLRTHEGKAYLFVAIDRASKYVYTEIYEHQTIEHACLFLRNLIAHCPFKITKILSDNGAQFTYELLSLHLRPKDQTHPFDALCVKNGIEHRLTQFRHPWTNGQVEVTNRILKNATTKTYFYDTLQELKSHMMAFVLYYNHQRKLKALKFQSPFDILIQTYQFNPLGFQQNPSHMIQGLNR